MNFLLRFDVNETMERFPVAQTNQNPSLKAASGLFRLTFFLRLIRKKKFWEKTNEILPKKKVDKYSKITNFEHRLFLTTICILGHQADQVGHTLK